MFYLLIFKHSNSAVENGTFGKQWELLKFEIGCAARACGKICYKKESRFTWTASSNNNTIITIISLRKALLLMKIRFPCINYKTKSTSTKG